MLQLSNFHQFPVTVDNVILGFDNNALKVLLIKRGEEPFSGLWALPGYFVQEEENIKDAAIRVLKQLTGLDNVFLEQVKAYGKVQRHPAGRVMTVSYFSLVKINQYQLTPSSIARKANWVDLSDVPKLAFDHNQILQDAIQNLQWSLRFRPIGFELLPPKFTLSELQKLYEVILNIELDKRNFRKKILAMDLLVDLEEYQENVAHRPAKLFKFNMDKYEILKKKGYVFDLTESNKKVSASNLQDLD